MKTKRSSIRDRTGPNIGTGSLKRPLLRFILGAAAWLAWTHGWGGEALARVTFYSAETCRWGSQSSTGVRLVEGKHVAVDPSVIPYGSRVEIPGLGSYTAVDTGSAVKSRRAARLAAGGDSAKAKAIVVDVFCKTRRKMSRMANRCPHYVTVEWTPPKSPDSSKKLAESTGGAAPPRDRPDDANCDG